MTVNKILIGLTFLLVAASLVGGIIQASDPFMWFVTDSPFFQLVRAVIAATLLGLLFTNPPRSISFRILLALGAICIGVATVYGVRTYAINLIDTFVFIEVAIIFAIEALEVHRKVKFSTEKSLEDPVFVSRRHTAALR